MSASQNDLCSRILRENFGEVVEKVAIHIMRKGSSGLRIIAQDTTLHLDQVRKGLCVMLQHNIACYEANKRGLLEYKIHIDEVFAWQRFPRYIYTIKTLYGDTAEIIVEELLHHGKAEMSAIVHRVTARLNETQDTAGQDKVSIYTVRDEFTSLVQTHFLQRCQALSGDNEEKPSSTYVPVFADEDEAIMFEVPSIETKDSRKRKRSLDDSSQPAKKIKSEDGSSSEYADTGVYWRVNYGRFDRYLRDQTIINAVGRKIDKRAGEVVRTILRLSEVKSDVKAAVTTPLSYNEILQAVPKDVGISKTQLDQYLKLLVEDSIKFVIRAGDSGGGLFSINFKDAFASLCKAHIESVVQERFGSKCLRIFKLLLLKKQLEQKQIEEFAMVPAKEAKEMLYQMFGQHFVTVTEVPKTPDHVPSRTFYFFSVNTNQVARMLLETCYKTLSNLMSRREKEIRENKRILDKQQRMEVIIASLEQNLADSSQREEVEQMITPTERAQLSRVKHQTNMMEQSELQVDDTVFILRTYLLYEHIH